MSANMQNILIVVAAVIAALLVDRQFHVSTLLAAA